MECDAARNSGALPPDLELTGGHVPKAEGAGLVGSGEQVSVRAEGQTPDAHNMSRQLFVKPSRGHVPDENRPIPAPGSHVASRGTKGYGGKVSGMAFEFVKQGS